MIYCSMDPRDLQELGLSVSHQTVKGMTMSICFGSCSESCQPVCCSATHSNSDICSRVCTENDITKWGMTYKSDSEKPEITAMSTLG